MSSNSVDLKAQLAKKEKELDEVLSTFSEIKTAYETLNMQMQRKDMEIQALKSQIEMKETQITTISSIIRTKDEFISSLQATLKMKDDQIFSLNEMKDMKSKELESLKKMVDESVKGSVDASIVQEKEKKIKELEEEIKLLNLDLKANDEEIEKLRKTGHAQAGTSAVSIGSGGVISGNVSREEIIKFIMGMVGKGLHNLNITTPLITDLAELQIYDVRASVNVKASSYVDIGNPEHQELVHELEALENISLRNFDEKDRWVCLKDNEEMFLAAVGDTNIAFYSKDRAHIKLFNSLMMESWLRARKI